MDNQIKNAFFGDVNARTIVVANKAVTPNDFVDAYLNIIDKAEMAGGCSDMDYELIEAREEYKANRMDEEKMPMMRDWLEEYADEVLSRNGIVLTHMAGNPASVMIADMDSYKRDTI